MVLIVSRSVYLSIYLKSSFENILNLIYSLSAKVLAEPSPARIVHDTLLPDGDLGIDLDAINPSLTDFDFQGELGAYFFACPLLFLYLLDGRVLWYFSF